jgi:tetratricopeptide (TPR) repeat protein
MSTRITLGISALAASLLLSSAALAQGAVTVIGGGLGQACYEAAEGRQIAPMKAMEICNLALTNETLKRRDKAATYTNRGILHMRMGNNTKAMWDYEKSLAMMPNLKEAKVNLGAALYNLKRYPEALAALNEGVGSESDTARTIGYYNRGLTHEKLGNLQLAYEDFREALRMKPDFKQAQEQIERFTVVPAAS